LTPNSYDGDSQISAVTDIAIIGAGPYGLSIAAHLSAAKSSFMIFGEPMENWRKLMPIGMYLKSDGFASSLSDPQGALTYRQFCADNGIAYADTGKPVSLESFCAYGQTFQKQMVPMLDPRKVADVQRIDGQFRLTLSDGATVVARKVIVASGISHFEYLPAELSALPREFLSHSAVNRDLSRFKGRDVLVLGAGASSTDIAALLVDQGASAQIVSREPVEFHDPPSGKPRSLWQRMRNPHLGLGPSWRTALFTLFPYLFRYIPLARRRHIIRKHLGPAAGWFIRDKVKAHVPLHPGYSFRKADVRGDRIHVEFSGRDGSSKEFDVHHIIAGTGYQVDLSRLPFLNDSIRAQVRLEANWPALSRQFESSVPGLYFVGLPSALTFGPLTRFTHGAGFTARRLSKHLRGRQSESIGAAASAARSR
jgi:cation diffusion facilitator CzcD-associated flavoprotein CzcO